MNEPSKQCYQLRAYGKVQGVGFRKASAAKAVELNLAGMVENQSDGSVLIEVEGESKAITDFITWCQAGPLHADVTELTYREVPLRNFSSFEVQP